MAWLLAKATSKNYRIAMMRIGFYIMSYQKRGVGMTEEQKNLIDCAETIKQYCSDHGCSECPLDDYGTCEVYGSRPDCWVIGEE